MREPQRIASFQGHVSCQAQERPLALTLIGRTADRPDEVLSVAFAFVAAAPPDLPETLADVSVERVDANRFRLRSGRQEWTFSAVACHLHREVAATFYRAISPRPAPWHKRLCWRLVLTMAAHPLGKRLLLAVRGR